MEFVEIDFNWNKEGQFVFNVLFTSLKFISNKQAVFWGEIRSLGCKIWVCRWCICTESALHRYCCAFLSKFCPYFLESIDLVRQRNKCTVIFELFRRQNRKQQEQCWKGAGYIRFLWVKGHAAQLREPGDSSWWQNRGTPHFILQNTTGLCGLTVTF